MSVPEADTGDLRGDASHRGLSTSDRAVRDDADAAPGCETFDREARRITVAGDRDTWLIRLDGSEDEWRAERSTDEADMTDLIFEILRIPKTVRGKRSKT